MAVRINQGRIIDLLPDKVRRQAIDMMLADDPARSIADWLTQHGHKVSFSAIARYKRYDLPKHVEIATKLQQIQADTPNSGIPPMSLSEATNAALAADPILSRVQNKYNNYDKMVSQAVKQKDFKGFAAVDRAETAALTLHAQLTGRLQQQGPSVAVQIVFSGNQPQNTVEPQTIDADVIDITPTGNK